MKTFIAWIVGLFLFGFVMFHVEQYERKREKVCTDKGMVLVKVNGNPDYCAPGTREGL